MDDKYNMKKPPSRLSAWVILIFASIAALVDAMVWLPFYRVCQANGHNVLAAIKTNTKAFALFAGLAAVFFVFWIIANIKFSKAKRFRGFKGRSYLSLI